VTVTPSLGTLILVFSVFPKTLAHVQGFLRSIRCVARVQSMFDVVSFDVAFFPFSLFFLV
jgi:hypothetical protein